MEKVIVFGAGVQGRKILQELKGKYKISLIFDNDPCKDNTIIDGIPVFNLRQEILDKTEYDAIFIGTLSGYKVITKQLIEMGVPSAKIVNSYVELPTKAREQFVRNLSMQMKEKRINGAVAEGGVFQGEFAKIINQCFSDRILYLFDTFEGFDLRDIEKECKYSDAKAGDYAITSESIVMNKMEYPEQVILKKGYFPESAIEVDDQFAFVNLDFDLYNPTKAGLEWFGERIVQGGGILVHDYFSSQFTGIKKAVDEIIDRNSRLSGIPIGDGISIYIVGF